MTNRSSSHQHCLVGNIRPKSKLSKRANKAKAAFRREERRAAQATRIEAARQAL
ncbi:hypothetical protein KA036_00100 [Candidatus Gracilibacteria bacterium]|jgi:hypothetical protein|nr:hypothetical protein [Candidatus Gracilibacteria bacterium]